MLFYYRIMVLPTYIFFISNEFLSPNINVRGVIFLSETRYLFIKYAWSFPKLSHSLNSFTNDVMMQWLLTYFPLNIFCNVVCDCYYWNMITLNKSSFLNHVYIFHDYEWYRFRSGGNHFIDSHFTDNHFTDIISKLSFFSS